MKPDDFSQLVASIKQAGQIRRGEMPPSRSFEFQPADIKAIRMNLGKSQAEFALMIGVSVATLQNWEQGRRHPEGPARALLKVAAENPMVFFIIAPLFKEASHASIAEPKLPVQRFGRHGSTSGLSAPAAASR